MQSSMVLVWTGALLIMAGLIYTAIPFLWKGRLSEARRVGPAGSDATLEPAGRVRAFNPRSHWPGIVLIALGIILMLTRALAG